jgi:hypothetical protein
MRDVLKKDLAINYMRGLVILFVVANHALYSTVASELTYLKDIYSSIFREGTTMFILISGYLFYYLKDRFVYKNFMTKKIENVLFPYLIMSVPAIALYVLGVKVEHDWIEMDRFHEIPTFLQILYLYVTGAHLGPLWYIPVIMLIFLCTPVILWMLEKINTLFLVILSLTLALFVSRPESNSNELLSFVHFSPIFIFGCILCMKRDYWLSILVERYYFFVGLLIYVNLIIFEVLPPFADKILLFLLLYAALYIVSEKNLIVRITEVLNFLAVYSFPIYFIHGYIVSGTKLYLGDYVFRSAIEYSFYSFFVFVLAVTFSILLTNFSAFLFRDKTNIIVGLNYKEYLQLK